MQYSLNEICLLPSAKPTDISSRSQVTCRDYIDRLPIFVAPMTSVINENNYKEFLKYNVIPVLPRGHHIDKEYPNFIWNSYSLQEIEEGLKNKLFSNKDQILIDIANGHMQKVYDLVKQLKKEWPMITVMIGNIAHPEIYRACVEAGVDYVRVGIGGGSQCLCDGTQVTMADGTYKNIEDIQVGDVLSTVSGGGSVTEIIHSRKDNCLLINDEISCTDDHKFLVINKSDKEHVTEDNLFKFGYWIEAKNLNKDIHLLVKIE